MTIALFILQFIILMFVLVYWIYIFISIYKTKEDKKKEYQEYLEKTYELEHKIFRNKDDLISLMAENNDLQNKIEVMNEKIEKQTDEIEKLNETIELLTSCQDCNKKSNCLNQIYSKSIIKNLRDDRKQLKAENERLKSNWEQLKQHIKAGCNCKFDSNLFVAQIAYRTIQDKMESLEEVEE